MNLTFFMRYFLHNTPQQKLSIHCFEQLLKVQHFNQEHTDSSFHSNKAVLEYCNASIMTNTSL